MVKHSIVVYKGGKALNYMLYTLQQYTKNTSYIIPISNDSGSCKEIMRVFGGPSIGDTRATLQRLSYGTLPERRAIKKLFAYRLHSEGVESANEEWSAIINGTSSLWNGIPEKYKGIIQSILLCFERERIDKTRSHFDLRNGCVGNFFFSGARLAFGVLESAILLYSTVAGISPQTSVMPIIDSSKTLTLAAELVSGKVVVGQSLITHPKLQLGVKRVSYEPLPAPIKKIFYLNDQSQIVDTTANTNVVNSINKSNCIIYGFGSFWTSILPSLITKGSGEAIAKQKNVKILMLNSFNDRETAGMSAVDYIEAVTNALNRYGELKNLAEKYITHLFVVEGSSVLVDKNAISKFGIKTLTIPADKKHDVICDGRRYPAFSRESAVGKIERLLKVHDEPIVAANTNFYKV